ncbi:MAG: SDR family NAD(P)-dependent oxidoreductase [Pseudomonadota bacterium]
MNIQSRNGINNAVSTHYQTDDPVFTDKTLKWTALKIMNHDDANVALVFGASAGLGRALAEQLAQSGYHLFMVSRTEKDLKALSQDLSLRYSIQACYLACDLSEEKPESIIDECKKHFQSFNLIAYVAGYSSPSLDAGNIDENFLESLAKINFLAPIKIFNALVPHIDINRPANLIFISSVAAVRARRKNMVYASSKRGTEFYMNALRHFFAKNSPQTNIQIYRAGYLDTSMNFGENRMFPKLQPQKAAKIIENNLGKNGTFYLPWWWVIIMSIYSTLPWPIYKKLNS